jgi:hypothetical protein
VSSVLRCRSPHEAPPHECLLCWAEIFFLLLIDEDGLLKWPKSRWIGIPGIQYTDSSPHEPGPLTRPLEGEKGQGAPEATRPSNGTRQRLRSEDHLKIQTEWTHGMVSSGELKQRAT